MLRRLIILLLIVGCDYAPTEHTHTDCAGVQGGNDQLDNCGTCDNDLSNDCVPDCAGIWGGTSVNDCYSVCNGDAEIDGCGICGGNNNNDCGLCTEWIQIIPEVNGFGDCFNIDSTVEIDLGVGETITGNIPTQIGYLINLTNLDLSNSSELVGDIPEEIGNLINLQYLDLSNNQLTGSIPAEIGNLTNLTTLNLTNNQLTGEIPSEVCDLLINNNNLSIVSIILGNDLTSYCP